MTPGSAKQRVGALLAGAALCSATPAGAQYRRPPLPREKVASYAARPSWRTWVGPTLESSFGRKVGSDFAQAALFGLSVQLRKGIYGPHWRILVNPLEQSLQESRLLTGLGYRSHFSFLDRDWSLGFGTHFEVRLNDHYWLLYATPAELGTMLFQTQSWRLQGFIGARRPIAGELIDSYLIDPNGINNEQAADDLRDAKRGDSWEFFFSIVIARAL